MAKNRDDRTAGAGTPPAPSNVVVMSLIGVIITMILAFVVYVHLDISELRKEQANLKNLSGDQALQIQALKDANAVLKKSFKDLDAQSFDLVCRSYQGDYDGHRCVFKDKRPPLFYTPKLE